MLEKISVWMFVGLILLVDGLIIAISGIYYWKHDGVAQVASYHPSLWWGCFMMLSGLFFIWINRFSAQQ